MNSNLSYFNYFLFLLFHVFHIKNCQKIFLENKTTQENFSSAFPFIKRWNKTMYLIIEDEDKYLTLSNARVLCKKFFPNHSYGYLKEIFFDKISYIQRFKLSSKSIIFPRYFIYKLIY